MEIPQKVIIDINKMFYCTSLKEHLLCFKQNYEGLKDCDFIIFSNEEGTKLPDKMCTNYDREFGIINIGITNQYYAMNKDICDEMLARGKSDYFIDVCINLDTQAISYLKDIFYDYSKIPDLGKKKGLIDFLQLKNIDYSCIPYLVENSHKVENKIDCYSNIKSFILFKSFDYKEYLKSGKVSYSVVEEEINSDTDKLYNCMFSDEFTVAYSKIFNMHKASYILLMKAICIEFENSKKSAKNKLMELIDFINNRLGFLPERELEICYYFFMHHEKTARFFKKVQRNNKELLKTVHGMAWDLIHVRLLEQEFGYKPIEKVKFAIHVLLTYDNGLKDILQINPIEQMAIYKGVTLSKFSHQFIDQIPNAREKLLSETNKKTRNRTFDNANYNCLATELEKVILTYMV